MVNQEWFEQEDGFSLRLQGFDDKKKLMLPIQSITRVRRTLRTLVISVQNTCFDL